MEVYVDDMVVRGCSVEEHVKDLTEVFRQIRRYGMRRNPVKCTFGVPTGKFLSLMLMSRGIEANLDKCKAVLEMRSPQNLKEVQRLVGPLTALSRFIPRLAERAKPIITIMRKNSSSKWDSSCKETFVDVKKILASPLIMGKPDNGSDLQLYLAVTDTIVNATLT